MTKKQILRFVAFLVAALMTIVLLCDLFEEVAVYVGEKLDYEYNRDEAEGGRKFLEYVKELPQDAIDMEYIE